MASPAVDVNVIRMDGLLEFVKRSWPLVESCDMVLEPHMEIICDHLEACAYFGTQSFRIDWEAQAWSHWLWKPDLTTGTEGPGGLNYLVIAIPPGFSKSLLCMVFFPAWVWTWCPQAKFITTSYGEDLALRDAKRSFELMNSEWYQARWAAPCTWTDAQVEIEGGERASMGYYTNTAKGSRFSTPMGGRPTGRHAHFLLSDDPIKPDDLKLGGDSAREALAKTHYRWDAIFSNRSADAATFCRVIIAQRLHVEDLSGHAIDQGAQHLRLPMEFEPWDAYASPWGSDWRLAEGQLLAPRRFSESVVSFRRQITPARDYAAQYQQRPSPEAGAVFQRDWFMHRHTGVPSIGAKLSISVDSSLKEGSDTDYTVLQVWAQEAPNRWLLLDQVRARMGFIDQVAALERLYQKHVGVRQLLIEDKANGTAIIDTLKRKYAGVMALQPQGGKRSRAENISPLWAAGNVLLPPDNRAPWLSEFVEEHLHFPVGRHDDQVDCETQYLTFASGRYRASRNKAAAKGMRQRMGRV